ncbi:deoxyribose-phosphate aldolase [Anaerobacterium chartisolvens]|uniref:Deoxyribose-phosphate aldolase n=1 Tax=Anaerobacterium chartisolvens TaxID=1297424 RepID=A0A369BBN0_9FIRM|nr:deoxyribose-phosphate aldolase [Anaerobacterium chartisolvens]
MEISKLIETITQEVLKELGEENLSKLNGSELSAEILPNEVDINNLAATCDHTVLKPDTTKKTIEKFCKEAMEWGFASVCVNPTHVRYAASILRGSKVKVCTVIGFPLGANTPVVKAAEVRDAIANGAQEVDMVINIGALKDGNYDMVTKDIKAVVDAAAGQALTKVIIETCLLTEQEKIKACLLAKNAGADYVKTSTGMSTGGATVEDISLMRKTVGPDMGVKASTGVNDREIALNLIRAGATRLGTSKGVAIHTGVDPNAKATCVNCGNCKSACPTGNAKVVKDNY